MPTSARWAVTNSPQIPIKAECSAGGQTRPPLRGARWLVVGADDSVGPLGSYEFAEVFRIKQCALPGRCGHRPLHWCVRIFELYQTSREKSRKTEVVFLVGSRRSGGKSKSLRARFLFATFSFGEAKEKVVPQLQISNMCSYLDKCIIDHKKRPSSVIYRSKGVSFFKFNTF